MTGIRWGTLSLYLLLSMQRPRPSMEMAPPASLNTAVNSKLVNWLLWLVLKISEPAVAVQGFSQGLDAEPGIQGVGQPPEEHAAGGQAHDGPLGSVSTREKP